MSRAQVIALKAHLWPAAARAQGWPVADRDRQMDILSRITSRKIESSNDLTNKEFNLVKMELETLADNLSGAMNTVEAAEGKSHLAVIRKELLPCLALYCGGRLGALDYIRKIARDKFPSIRSLNPQLSTLDLIDSLSPYPNVINGRETKSQIQQLLYTLNSRLNGKRGLRNKAGHTVAQMRAFAFQKPIDLCDPSDPTESDPSTLNPQPSTSPDPGGIARAASDLDASDASTEALCKEFETANTPF